jgi:DNA repair exonuclease SbcCD ATPase subunit
MILHLITLSNWRCFLRSVTVGPFGEGITVIHGPNGTGKSTLFEALSRGLLDSHSVSGQDVTALVPWGRALPPRVTVEFRRNDVDYRIAKQFLQENYSRLDRLEGDIFIPLAEGRQADDTVRTMLTRNPPARGLSQPRHWGLAQVLWAPQGKLLLTDLSGDIVNDIRSSLGAQLSQAASSPVEERIVDLYLQYFTKGGKLKSGRGAPELSRMKEQLVQVQRRRQGLFERLQLYEDGSRRVEDIRARRTQLVFEAEALNKTINDLRSQTDAYRQLRVEADRRKEEARTAEARYNQLKQAIDHIREKERAHTEARFLLKTLEEDLVAKTREASQHKSAANAARKTLDVTAKEEENIRRAEQDARDAEDYLKISHSREVLEKEIERITAATQQMQTRQRARLQVVAPDLTTLRKIRKAIHACDQAAVRIESSLISLEILPTRDIVIETISGEPRGETKALAGAKVHLTGSPDVVAEVKGMARLRATGPRGEIQNHQAEWDAARAQIDTLTRPYGTADVDQLEAMAENAAELDRQIRESAKALETLLGHRELSDMKQQLVEKKAVEAGFLQSHPAWSQAQPDFTGMMRAVSDLREAHGKKIAEAHHHYTKSQAVCATAEEQVRALGNRIDETRKLVRQIDRSLAGLTEDGRTMEERQVALRGILMDREAAWGRLQSLEEKLGVYNEDPLTALEKFERQLNGVREDARNTRDDEMTAAGRLATLAAEGPYSAFSAVDEHVNQLIEDIHREEMRVEAIRLLYETVTQCRSDAVAAVTAPVEARASRILQRINGPRLGRIRVTDSFEPTEVQPGAIETGVGFENLSGGEMEQLYLATRLALAEVLASKERQMVVLDDVLTATDAGRLTRVLGVLEESARRLQILILTCHPERYRGLGDTHFIDLEAIARAAGSD